MAISAKGLQKLGFVPQVDFFLKDDSDGSCVYMEWVSDQHQPTKAEIESAHNEWKAEYDTQEYARKRQEEYPSTDELIVALWENVVEERAASVVSLEAKRQAIKTKYPK